MKEMMWTGISDRNIGTQFTIVERQKKLPFRNHVWSQELENVSIRWYHLTLENLQQWNLTFLILIEHSLIWMEEVKRKNISNKQCFASCNCWCRIISLKAVNIRLGYNFRRAEELSCWSTLGFQLVLDSN
jgi:hypothetical protein